MQAEPNQMRVYGDFAEMDVMSKYGKVVAILSPESVVAVSRYRWCRFCPGRGKKYLFTNRYEIGKPRVLLLHRLLMGEPAGEVDHINGNPLDNRLCNLRILSKTGNSRNCQLSRANTSGVKGVSFDRRRRRWFAYGRLDGRHINLGLYDTLEEASVVATAWRAEHYPESPEARAAR